MPVRVWVKKCVLPTMVALALLSPALNAQTVTLPAYEDTTLRGGAYENTNFGDSDLATRASADLTYSRHALLKFDTHNTIPAGATITSATLTVTVKGGNSETRTLTAFCVPQAFWEHQATWTHRNSTLFWSQAGGTVGHAHDTAAASGVAGSAVTFDATAMVREALGGSARYTRVLLVDAGADSKGSLRYFHSNESSSTAQRPKLVVSFTSTTAVPAPTTTTTGSTLRVMQWNIHQGHGSDGRSNIDRVVDWIVKAKADVVTLNEVMKYSTDNQPQMITDKLRARTGQTWYSHWVQKWGATSGEGVAVVSRYSFQDTDRYFLSYDRSVALVRVTVNGRTVHVASTHLDHQSSSYRLTQVRQLKTWLSGIAQQRIVAGDFNWYPGTAEINEMCKDYYDAWAVAKSKGTATSYSGNPDGNTRNTRIDYVFYSKGATALTLVSAQVLDTRADLVSDHRPVLATFRVN